MSNKRCMAWLLCAVSLLLVCVPWGVAYATNDTVPTAAVTTTATREATTATGVTTTAPRVTTAYVTTVTTTEVTAASAVTTTAPDTVVPRKKEGQKNLHWPLAKAEGTVRATYGYRWGELHRGVDMAAAIGDTVLAAADGKVIACEGRTYNGGYGMTVLIDHGDGVHTLYAHLDSIAVAVGDCVTAGQAIATAGMTGEVTGSCLHFEVRVNEVAVDPLLWLNTVNDLQEEGENDVAN